MARHAAFADVGTHANRCAVDQDLILRDMALQGIRAERKSVNLLAGFFPKIPHQRLAFLVDHCQDCQRGEFCLHTEAKRDSSRRSAGTEHQETPFIGQALGYSERLKRAGRVGVISSERSSVGNDCIDRSDVPRGGSDAIEIGEHGDFVGNCDADTPNPCQCPYAAHSPFKVLDLEGEIDEVQSRMLKCGIVNLWRERVLDRISDQRAQARFRVNN